MHPVLLYNQRTLTTHITRALKSGLDVPEGLPQVLLRLACGYITPEQTGKRFTRVLPIPIQQQVGEEFLGLCGLQTLHGSALLPYAEPAQHTYLENRHSK